MSRKRLPSYKQLHYLENTLDVSRLDVADAIIKGCNVKSSSYAIATEQQRRSL